MSVFGDVLTFNYDTVYAGTTPPALSAPWLRATFTDINSTTVQLKLEGVDLAASEFATTWAFNVDPTINLNSISFTLVSSVGYSGNTTPSLSTNGEGAGPAHGFDIDMSLTPSAKFGQGDQLVYTLTRTAGLSAASFLFTNGSGSIVYSGAHIQGVDNGTTSDWVSSGTPVYTSPVPEATTVAAPIFAAALAGFTYWRRKARRQA
ncbi:MAG TPA: hypothetical protein VMF06_05325 [Candidatus Limnocylindria bacterium]|nr:hypothetical protein [Candidatus Limnocylindria bacterium]